MSAIASISPYYAATAHAAPHRAALRGLINCDVCVIGGGITGCSAALHLAARGYAVALLEEHCIGWGASGRNGGQAHVGVAAGQTALERLVGRTDARAIWDMSVEALALLRTLIARYTIQCDWADGQMLVAIRPHQEGELREQLLELRERYSYGSVRFLERDELRSLIASSRYIAGMHDSNGGHLHPLNYTLGLAAAAESHGARLFEGSPALRFDGTGPVRVHTATGEVHCRQLLLCGNTSLGAGAAALRTRILAVGSCVIATEPLGAERADALIANNAAVADMNWVLDYFRRSADQRLIFGGRVTYSGFDPARIAASTRSRMVAVFPQLTDVRVEHAWGGYIDITRNRAPHFGRLGANVYFMQGFSGQGIVLAGLAGKLVAEAVAGEAERFDIFARIPHHGFPGGVALRRPALVLAMLYYRLKDLL